MPLPPPVHGAALRNKSLIESPLINEYFSISVLPFNFAEETNDLGKPSLRKVGKFLARAWQLISRVMTFRPDVVYFNITLNGISLYRDFLYVILLKLLRTPLVYHLRTQGVKVQSRQSSIKRRMFKFIFRGTSVISLSEFLAKDVEDVYAGKPYIVNNGIKDMASSYPPREYQDNVVPVILFISNLARSKGVVELIQAFGELRKRAISFTGWIVGDAHELSLQEVQDLINTHGVEDVVTLLGPKFGGEKFDLLRQADIFVLPTHFEAFPGAVIEAMQFSVPVISTIEGAIPEILDYGKAGVLVEKRNVSQLADKMQFLLNSPEARHAVGALGRHKFESAYTMERFEEGMTKVLTDIILKNSH